MPAFRSLIENTSSNLVPNKDLAKRFGAQDLADMAHLTTACREASKRTLFLLEFILKVLGAKKIRVTCPFLAKNLNKKERI